MANAQLGAPVSPKSGTFDTSIKAWLTAMTKAQKIKPGGKLLFINKRTGNGSAPE